MRREKEDKKFVIITIRNDEIKMKIWSILVSPQKYVSTL